MMSGYQGIEEGARVVDGTRETQIHVKVVNQASKTREDRTKFD